MQLNFNTDLSIPGHAVDHRDDPNQLKVYTWQAGIQTRLESTPVENRVALALVDYYVQMLGAHVSKVSFHDMAMPVAGFETDDSSLLLPSHRTTLGMVAHEIAHSLAQQAYGMDIQGHGPEFVEYLIVALAVYDDERMLALGQSAREAGIL